MTTRTLLLAVGAALFAGSAAQARPPDHYQTIGWMSSVDLDCDESAQNPFAPSDHICTVKRPSSVWATSARLGPRAGVQICYASAGLPSRVSASGRRVRER